MQKIYIILISLALSGCGLTPQGDAARLTIKERGAKVMDELLTNAEWVICVGSSKGSLDRRYAKTQQTADTYRAYCNMVRGVQGTLIAPMVPIVSPDLTS